MPLPAQNSCAFAFLVRLVPTTKSTPFLCAALTSVCPHQPKPTIAARILIALITPSDDRPFWSPVPTSALPRCQHRNNVRRSLETSFPETTRYELPRSQRDP